MPVPTAPETVPSLPARALRRLETWPPLRRLDPTPFRRALLFGLLLGLLAGAAILGLPAGARLAAAAVVVALAGAVAWSAQPVGIWEPAKATEPLLNMVAIEAGSFLMGSPEHEKGRRAGETQHRVELSDFRMARTTVTKAQYQEVMELDEAPGPGGDDHPVTNVSWFDAITFCNRLSERENLPPCYRIEDREVSWIEDTGGYRLPTEAEWEYAARAGSKARWPFGDKESKLGRYAWFGESWEGDPHPVDQKKRNRWGLADMHGNVWEWCWDAYGEYPAEPAEDPRGPDQTPGGARVRRGGAFFSEPGFLRSAVRDGDRPKVSRPFAGFRFVRRSVRQLDPSTP